MNRYISLLLSVILLATVSCQQDELVSGDTDERVTLTYRVSVGTDDVATRAIGDGSQVNVLTVEVFEGEKSVYRKEGLEVETGKSINVPLSLFRGHTYNVVFWAQNKEVTAYDTDDLSQITVDYSKYSDGFAAMESLDAFYAVDKEVTVEKYISAISLQRPFAQVNFGNDTDNAHDKVTVTVKNPATVFNPFTGTAKVVDNKAQAFTFTKDFPEEMLNVNGKDYSYIATAYLFVPADGAKTIANVTIANGGSEKSHDDLKLSLVANTRFNVIGSLVGVQYTYWLEGYAQPKDIHHITTPAELAWWMGTVAKDASVHTDTHENCTIYIDADLDMAGIPMDALDFPDNVTILGQNHTIKNVVLRGKSETETTAYTALLGDVNGLTVSDLTIDGLTLNSSAATGIGALAGKASGTLNFTNVKVQNATVSSSATTNSIAGGLVGYISRKTATDRDEKLTATFSQCQANNVTLTAKVAGKLVGELSGYDNGEVLNFDATCTATNVSVGTYASPYVEGNESCWLADNDYSAYNAFLGNETYCRGVVNYGANRFTQKWDGQRTVEPMLANATYDGNNVTTGTNKYVVYSPFDLAGIRNKTASPSAIYLKTNIDMYGQGADGKYNVPSNFNQSAYTSTDDNPFSPFNDVTTLDGYKSASENFSIYNLCIEQLAQESAAFILSASDTTTHKNINFRNCQTVATHKEVKTDAKAYGAILVSNVDATYTMSNVHAYDCKVFALQKVGTLGARINGTSTLNNNSVNNCYVENYQCWISEEFTSGEISISVPIELPFLGTKYYDVTAKAYKSFYPHGEAGGMYGFIQGNSTITGCKVNTMTVNAYGQDDVKAEYKVVKSDYNLINDKIVSTAMSAMGLYLIPGRHVSTFIGDIRATGSIQLQGCIVDNASKCTNRWDKHNDTYHYIGQGYYVKYLDSEGTITVDGKSLTVADCKTTTKR